MKVMLRPDSQTLLARGPLELKSQRYRFSVAGCSLFQALRGRVGKKRRAKQSGVDSIVCFHLIYPSKPTCESDYPFLL